MNHYSLGGNNRLSGAQTPNTPDLEFNHTQPRQSKSTSSLSTFSAAMSTRNQFENAERSRSGLPLEAGTHAASPHLIDREAHQAAEMEGDSEICKVMAARYVVTD